MTPTDWAYLGFTLLAFGEVTREIGAALPFRAFVFIAATFSLGIALLHSLGVF